MLDAGSNVDPYDSLAFSLSGAFPKIRRLFIMEAKVEKRKRF